jgi:hypothetical protein
VSAVHAGGSPGEPTSAQFVVFEAIQIGVQTPRRGAFAQVNEGFHGHSRGRSAGKLKSTLVFDPISDKEVTTR